jgi:hypothetical protein
MDYPSLKRLHSIAKVLSTIEEGNSLTDIQLTSGLSFTTVQKTVKDLESSKIISTRMKRQKRGKIREIVWISDIHKQIAIFFDNIIKKTHFFISGQENFVNSSLMLFEIEIFEKTEENMINFLSAEVSEELGSVFEKWTKNEFVNNKSTTRKMQESELTAALEKNLNGLLSFVSENLQVEIQLKDKTVTQGKSEVTEGPLDPYLSLENQKNNVKIET